MNLEVVQGTAFTAAFPAKNVLILGEEEPVDGSGTQNFWLAEIGKITGQGFTLKLDSCKRVIAGFQIKNKGRGVNSQFGTKAFKVSGSKNEKGPWERLVEDELVDTRGKAASLLNFTFDQPVEVQYLKFELVSYWGSVGGGLQYFAPILATRVGKSDFAIGIGFFEDEFSE